MRCAFLLAVNTSLQISITGALWTLKDQSAQFQKFIVTFHEKLQDANSNVMYKSGSTPGAYMGNVVLSILIIAMLIVAAVFFLSIGLIWLVGLKLLLIIFYMPTLFKLLKRNRPGNYNPVSIPTALLPV